MFSLVKAAEVRHVKFRFVGRWQLGCVGFCYVRFRQLGQCLSCWVIAVYGQAVRLRYVMSLWG